MNWVAACPGCGTAFYVRPEHLQASAGQVRCGHCAHIFNAQERLVEVEAPAALEMESIAEPAVDMTQDAMPEELQATTPDTPTDAADAPLSQAPAGAGIDSPAALEAAEEKLPDNPVDADLPSAPEEVIDPPAIDPAEAPADNVFIVDEAVNPSATQPQPPRLPSEPEPSALSFMQVSTKEKSTEKTWIRIFRLIVVVLLLLAALGQLAYQFRSALAAQWPPIRSYLLLACSKLGCTVALPQSLNALVLDDTSMEIDQAHANVIRLAGTLSSNASYAVAYPALELTLTDVSDIALLRRKLQPGDYLNAQDRTKITQGLQPGEEIHFRLALEATEGAVSGYRLLLKY